MTIRIEDLNISIELNGAEAAARVGGFSLAAGYIPYWARLKPLSKKRRQLIKDTKLALKLKKGDLLPPQHFGRIR